MNSRLALGAAQFGLDYGVANQAGRVQIEEVRKILQLAKMHSIDTLDTAIAYGESENNLGLNGVSNWKVVTKLPSIPDDCGDITGWVESQIAESLVRLGIEQLHGVLLHRPEQLWGARGSQIYKALQNLKTNGVTKKVGISIYTPDELDNLLAEMNFDLVQAPLNILDRRLIESGWASRLKASGVELHVRSAFLQGLLIMPTDQRPVKFDRWRPIWTEWARWLKSAGLTPLQACLAYVLAYAEVDKVVVGVESVNQLNEILGASSSVLPNLPDWLQPIDPILIDPSQWTKL